MYNDSGIRTQKVLKDIPGKIVLSTTNYHLVGNKVTYEENGTDKIYYTYDASGKLVSMNISTKNTDNTWTRGVEYYYIRNAQGDIIGLFDKTGTPVVSYVYDSWGKLISIKDGSGKDVTSDTTTVGVKNPYRYRGYRYDTETGLYYLQSRYYNPDWGRFINSDTLAGSVGELLSHNLFAYCKNNPVTLCDPSGFRPMEAEYREFCHRDVSLQDAFDGFLEVAFLALSFCDLLATGNPEPLESRFERESNVVSQRISKANLVEKTSELTTTHQITMSNNKFKKFVDVIKNEGIKEPIKYVEQSGSKYVVDGHHRLQAAKMLGIKEVPIEKVELPYLGYKAIEDLFWGD